MRYRTYKNMVKATQLIADKGYDWDEANRMAIKIFDNYMNKNSNSVEFYIDKIMPKQEWLEYLRSGGVQI